MMLSTAIIIASIVCLTAIILGLVFKGHVTSALFVFASIATIVKLNTFMNIPIPCIVLLYIIAIATYELEA